MAKEKRINAEVKYTGLETVVKKNFYAVGYDGKLKKSVIKKFNGLTKLQAKNAANEWAAAEKVALEGVYFN